jgi:VanZ family protein
MTQGISRAFAWIIITAILILSVVPPSLRPITGVPHKVEHFAIFALCGLAFGLGYRMAGLFEGMMLVMFAGAVELLQLIVPGRHARLSDFAVDAFASCVGVMIGRLWTATARGRSPARVTPDPPSRPAAPT